MAAQVQSRGVTPLSRAEKLEEVIASVEEHDAWKCAWLIVQKMGRYVKDNACVCLAARQQQHRPKRVQSTRLIIPSSSNSKKLTFTTRGFVTTKAV